MEKEGPSQMYLISKESQLNLQQWDIPMYKRECQLRKKPKFDIITNLPTKYLLRPYEPDDWSYTILFEECFFGRKIFLKYHEVNPFNDEWHHIKLKSPDYTLTGYIGRKFTTKQKKLISHFSRWFSYLIPLVSKHVKPSPFHRKYPELKEKTIELDELKIDMMMFRELSYNDQLVLNYCVLAWTLRKKTKKYFGYDLIKAKGLY